LSLNSNQKLSDISALATANLPQLKTLSLYSNQISDIAPVHKNKTLSSTLSTLDFRYNPLSKVSILNYVPLLTKKIRSFKFTYPVGWDLINLDKAESYKISFQVSPDPNFILINSSVVVLVRLKEPAETNRLIVGETVNLVVDRGAAQSPAVANGDGTYSAKYTADSTIGDVKIQAVTNSGTLASTKIRLVDTIVDRIVYQLDQNPNLASGHVLINSMNNLTLKLLDSKGELVSGEILDLSAGRGTIQSPAIKNSDGTYSAMYTAGNKTGSAAIKGIIKGSTDKRDLGSLKIQVVDIRVKLSVTQSRLPASLDAKSNITIYFADTRGSKVKGQTLVYLTTDLGAVSSPLDNGDGTYTARYTGAETPGRAKITATSESGKSGTTTIQLDGVDGEKSKFKIFGSAAAQTGQPVSIEVLLVTTRGAPLSRRRVDLKIEPNADVQIKSAEKTNLEGKTIITFTAGTAGIYTLKGRSGKTILDGNLAAIFTGDPVVLPEMEDVEIISIPDPALRKVLESALHKWPGGDIIREHLEDLKTLPLAGKQIQDWTGLEYCISLQQLDLSNHQLQDLTSLPWAQLTRLTQLNLSNNQISDFSLLSNLASLQSLDLSHNQIYELSALVGLTYLGQLKLNHNQISDLTPLAKLPNLTQLYLGSGQKEQQNLVRDLKPLQNLPSLQELYLSGNQINNIGPIASLPALKSLELYHNPLNKSSLLIHIPALEERKVTVSHNSSAPPSTTISGGTVQNGDQEIEVELLNQKGIVLQFSDRVSPGQVELKAKEGEALTVQAKWEEDQLTLNLPANQTFGYQTTYIIRLTGVKDADGIALEGDQVTFTTKEKSD